MKKIKLLVRYILLMVVLLPVAFIMTVIIHPFWRWFERQTGIESYGHSGPSEWCYWVDYSILVLLSIVVLHKIQKHGKNYKNNI